MRSLYLGLFVGLINSLYLGTADAVQYCTADKSVCFTSTPTDSNMMFEVTTKSRGWVALGFGSNTMQNSNMIVLWTRNGQKQISDRRSNSESEPRVNFVQTSQLLDDSETTAPAGTTVYRFIRPIQARNNDEKTFVNGELPMSWAWSNSVPTEGGQMSIHDAKGSMTLNLFSTQSITGNVLMDYRATVIAHGIMMFAAWGLFATSGIFIARFMKQVMGVWWFRAHIGLLALTAALTIAAFGIIVATTGTHFRGPHTIIGLIVFILTVLQVILGIAIDRLFDPKRTKIPWYDMAHWWLGRIVFLLAIVAIFLGIKLFAPERNISSGIGLILMCLFGAFVGIVLILFIVAQIRIGGTQHEESDDADTSKPQPYQMQNAGPFHPDLENGSYSHEMRNSRSRAGRSSSDPAGTQPKQANDYY